jgi:hypothetical protein
MKKRLLIENDVPEMTDFQKILLLNKRKLDSDDVEFKSDNYEDLKLYHVQIKPDGLLFDFNDLEQFLKFFHYPAYEKGTDGEWDATNYDRMYYGSYDFYSECQDRAYDDWSEGYTLGYLCREAKLRLKELLKLIAPNLVDNIHENGRIDGEGAITSVLDKYFQHIGDEMDEIICSAKANATEAGVKEAIEKEYCNTLSEFGVEKWGKWCFGLYFISWGNLVQLFVEDGEFDGNALDLLIQKIEKKFRHGLPEYYEMEYYVMDNEMFESESCEKLVNLIDEYIERAQEEFSPEYAKTMDKLSSLGLFNTSGLEIPGQKGLRIKVEEVDPETLEVKYILGQNSYFGDRQYGLSTPDSVIAMATQPGLFSPTEYRIQPGQLKR